MGTFHVGLKVENHVHRRRSATVAKALVDTGSGYTWLRFAYRARTNDGVLVIQPVFKASLTETNWSTNGVVQKVSGQPAGDGVHEDQVWQTPIGSEARRFLRLQISR